MNKTGYIILLTALITSANLCLLANNNRLTKCKSFDSALPGYLKVSVDSVPNTQKNSYAKAVDYIINDKGVYAYLSHLSGKHAKRKRKINIKVSDVQFERFISSEDLWCINDLPDTINPKEGPDNGSFNLSELSSETPKYNYVVFFSSLNEGKLACKIVRASNAIVDEDYYIKTRFGKVLTIKFCFTNNEITNVELSLSTSG